MTEKYSTDEMAMEIQISNSESKRPMKEKVEVATIARLREADRLQSENDRLDALNDHLSVELGHVMERAKSLEAILAKLRGWAEKLNDLDFETGQFVLDKLKELEKESK